MVDSGQAYELFAIGTSQDKSTPDCMLSCSSQRMLNKPGLRVESPLLARHDSNSSGRSDLVRLDVIKQGLCPVDLRSGEPYSNRLIKL